MKLVSACLLGVNCKYNGENNKNEKVLKLLKKELLIPVCPEQLGGQITPRPNTEIVSGTGKDVIEGNAKVIEKDGKNVTKEFIKGAEETLKIARMFEIKEAIMKARSPSCGCGKIYDGTFSGKLINGDGITTALLKKNGIKVISEEDL